MLRTIPRASGGSKHVTPVVWCLIVAVAVAVFVWLVMSR